MALHNALHSGQANSSAFEVFGAMQSLENAKEFVRIFHVETNPVIANENGGFVFTLRHSDFDDCLFTGPGELDGVQKQVLHDLFDRIGSHSHCGSLAMRHSTLRSLQSAMSIGINSSMMPLRSVMCR